MRTLSLVLVFGIGIVVGTFGVARLQATTLSHAEVYLPVLTQRDGATTTPTVATATPTVATTIPAAATATLPLPLDPPPLVFVSYRDGNAELYSVQSGGTGMTRLTHTAARETAPRISPDGHFIVFVSNRAGNDDIYRMKADRTDVVQLTSSTDNEDAPDWSPDGKQIVFEAQRNQRWILYLMHVDGGDQQAITFATEDNHMPRWSPDGNSIAYVHQLSAGVDPRAQIRVLRPDNLFGTVYLVTDYMSYVENPVWSPQSTLLAFDCVVDLDGGTELVTVTIENLGMQFGKMTRVYDAKDPTIDIVIDYWG